MEDGEHDIVELFVQRVHDASTRDGLLRLVKLMLVANIDAPQVQLAACKELCAPASLSNLADDAWVVLEAGALAAVQQADAPFARACLDKLGARFPSSARVTRLSLRVQECEAALSSEGGGLRSAVERGYKAALAAAETDTALIRRLIAMKRESGGVDSALDMMRSYLEGLGASDVSAWLECADMHASHPSLPSLPRAAFCLEEALLMQPANAAHHTRLAEILAHLSAQLGPGDSEGGGVERARMARLHASEAVRLTHKGSPSALAALADACYAHARLASGCAVRPSELLLPGRALTAEGGSGAAAGGAAGGGGAGGRKGGSKGAAAVPEAVQESIDLHAYARRTLASLRSGPVGSRLLAHASASVRVASLTVPLSSVFPAVALDASLLSEAAAQRLQAQAEALAL